MRIPTGVILMWGYSNATIPSGYIRETGLDGRYPKGAPAGQNPNAVGGAASHTHTSPAHIHQMYDHTHTFDLSEVPATSDAAANGNQGLIQNRHIHEGISGGKIGGDTSATSVVYGAYSNDPPYKTVIYIRSLGINGLPDGVIALWHTASLPAGWRQCNGQNGDPDYSNVYMKGAPANQDAGATGGSVTNDHNLTHTHTPTPHYHTASTGVPLFPITRQPMSGIDHNQSGNAQMHYNHTHSFNFDTTVQNLNPHTGSVGAQSEIVEPLHKRLIAIINRNGRIDSPKGLVGLWLGNIDSIPKGWVVCDGQNGTPDLRNYFVKMGDSLNVLQTGGSNIHGHAPQTHSHSANGGHVHGGAVGHALVMNVDGVGPWGSQRDGTHTVVNCQNVSVGYKVSATTADPANNEPEYRTVVFIQFQKEYFNGAALYNSL